jgi:hAT family C-terminal dimerisation region
MVLRYIDETNQNFHVEDSLSLTTINESAEVGPPPVKKSKLFANYESTQSSTAQHTSNSSTFSQTNKYLEMPEESTDDNDNCLSFWKRNSVVLNKLIYPAARALGVPASSSPVKRVFSHGGIILRPHRARMSDSLLSKLVFLKCNNLSSVQE